MTEQQLIPLVLLVVGAADVAITALVTSAEARESIKVGVSIVVAALGAAIVAFGQYQSGVTDWLVLAMAAWGTGQLIYKAADKAFESRGGVNEQPVFLPDQGLG